jgi:hypothetical protein
VDKHFVLALFHHGGGCERVLNDEVAFPAPFAHHSDGALGLWWEDVLQTAKALMFEQGRPGAPLTDVAAKVVRARVSNCRLY